MTAQETGVSAFQSVNGMVTFYDPEDSIDAYLTGYAVNVGDWE